MLEGYEEKQRSRARLSKGTVSATAAGMDLGLLCRGSRGVLPVSPLAPVRGRRPAGVDPQENGTGGGEGQGAGRLSISLVGYLGEADARKANLVSGRRISTLIHWLSSNRVELRQRRSLETLSITPSCDFVDECWLQLARRLRCR